ncbi:MAG: DUF4783 domain-containing protein [Ignavibacteriales bacterium]|nr:MAG: DUF4783 domain-containing protein [Ignavibacteriales bacterium]
MHSFLLLKKHTLMVCFFISFNYFGVRLEKKMKSNNKKTVILLISSLLLILNFNSVVIKAQGSTGKGALKVFLRIEDGMAGATVDKFSKYFGNKNYLSLSNGVSGYYSTNQSYYVIKDFLSIYQPTFFKLTNIVTETATPFASGILKYSTKGVRGSSIVFISLHFIDGEWKISQITIN